MGKWGLLRFAWLHACCVVFLAAASAQMSYSQEAPVAPIPSPIVPDVDPYELVCPNGTASCSVTLTESEMRSAPPETNPGYYPFMISGVISQRLTTAMSRYRSDLVGLASAHNLGETMNRICIRRALSQLAMDGAFYACLSEHLGPEVPEASLNALVRVYHHIFAAQERVRQCDAATEFDFDLYVPPPMSRIREAHPCYRARRARWALEEQLMAGLETMLGGTAGVYTGTHVFGGRIRPDTGADPWRDWIPTGSTGSTAGATE